MRRHGSDVFIRSMVLLLLTAPGGWMPGRAQDVDPRVRRQALEAYHGPDLEGKDGPLAKVGFDLALLYHEWQAYRQRGEAGSFTPSRSSLSVRNGSVTVDATAAGDAAALRRKLENLGLEKAARAGRVVSGRLPIAEIPQAARLAELSAMRPARAMTPDGQPAPTRLDTTTADRTTTPAAAVWYVASAVALVVVGLLLWVLRR